MGNKPWFGPKRIGFGIRPRTWQGWVIMLVLAALLAWLISSLAH